ncbi:MAG: helix-turn-helix transcriptional regulator [Clostridia bacterium]|nr:helix-turn-helix transcriptional regulator [Clostridia bacterium]
MQILRQPDPKSADFCTCGQFVSDKGGAVHPHRKLDTYVLLFGNSGEYRISQNGTEYRLLPDTYLLLLAEHEHLGTAPCAPGLRHYWAHFFLTGEALLSEGEGEDEAKVLISAPEGGGRPLLIPEYGKVKNRERIRLLLHQLIDTSRTANLYQTELCNSILQMLLMEISDSYIREVTQKEESSRADFTAAQVMEWIRLNACTIRKVSEVGDHFGYNSEYLTTLLKKATNRSLTDHITAGRIEAAKQLLLCSNQSVKEIAYACGFGSDKYFLRVFREKTGLTPGEYRTAYYKMHYNA